jgi:hypothetical protein
MKAALYPRLLEQLVRGRNGHSGVYLEKAYRSSFASLRAPEKMRQPIWKLLGFETEREGVSR